MVELKASQIYKYMQEYQRQHRYPPTQREIMAALGMHVQTVQDRLKLLESVGAIVRRRYSERGAYIPSEPNQYGG